MGKRKRLVAEGEESVFSPRQDAKQKKVSNGPEQRLATIVTVQVVVGTYEKILHGIQATVSQESPNSSEKSSSVEFADTFLLSPHGSAIRCLAISPPSTADTSKSQKAILASGSSDQIINLYHISREAPKRSKAKGIVSTTIANIEVKENPRNRELGSLQHHSGSINAIHFPTRSKLLSAAEDNTIAVARTRDWTILSTIKAPIPKAHGRPSGDTAPLGGTPAGVNDFAIHPSMKLMVSVGKGEKCMRLWNLVTGKKAGVLNFERDLLQKVGEGKFASGEGRRVEWSSLGEAFVVGFERGCVLFGMDCKPKSLISPSPATKLHQLHYTTISSDTDELSEILAVSTEDGRILFYSTASLPSTDMNGNPTPAGISLCTAVAQLGGIGAGLTGRIKDFEILKPPDTNHLLIVTGSSDGAVRIWMIDKVDLQHKLSHPQDSSETEGSRSGKQDSAVPGSATKLSEVRQIGKLLGTYEAGNRITCLKAFIMSDPEAAKASGLSNGMNKANAHGTEKMEVI